MVDPRVKQLEKEDARLQRRINQAETIIEIQAEPKPRPTPARALSPPPA